MKADRTALLRMVLCFTLCLAALPVNAAPPLPQGPEIRVNTRSRTFSEPSVAVFPDGGFVVAWDMGGGNRVRLFDRQGKPVGPERGLQIRGRVQQVIADLNSSFLVLSKGSVASSVTLFLRRFHRDGTPMGPFLRVPTGAHIDGDPIAAVAPDGHLAVAWGQDIYGDPHEASLYTNAVAQIFTPDRTPLKQVILVAGEPATQAGDDTLRAFPTALAFKPDGTLVAVVRYHVGGCFQTLLAMVHPDGGPMRRSSLGSPFCGPPGTPEASLTVGRDGGLIATWSEQDIQAQRLAPDETPREPWFQVAQHWLEEQTEPVSTLQAGNFVIVWTEEMRDGDGKGIFGRAFAANGAPRSGDFRINVTTEGDQNNPAIAAAARQGPIVVVWTQPTGRGGDDIFARVLSETR